MHMHMHMHMHMRAHMPHNCVRQVRLDDNDEGVPVTTLREVALLKDLRHENIVRLREVRASPPKFRGRGKSLFLIASIGRDISYCLEALLEVLVEEVEDQEEPRRRRNHLRRGRS